MSDVLLQTKLFVPQPRPGFVPRPHPLRKLNAGVAEGAGKLTLASGAIRLDAENPSVSEISPITVNIQSFQSDKFLRDQRIRQEFLEGT